MISFPGVDARRRKPLSFGKSIAYRKKKIKTAGANRLFRKPLPRPRAAGSAHFPVRDNIFLKKPLQFFSDCVIIGNADL